MLDLTDRHFRYLLRLITRGTLLYTEMLTAQAVLHGDPERLLARREEEGATAVQLAGDDPDALARAASVAVGFGYAEVNLNVGCPSERVQRGSFGACLMAEPALVAEIVGAMRAAVSVPVTVKHRIGIDQMESYAELARFVEVVAGSNPDALTVHARKAWLQGLSPRENRTVPPLKYGYVHRLKSDFPELTIELNGGISTPAQVEEQLRRVDGVMVGRALYEAPLRFAGVDALIARNGGRVGVAGEPLPKTPRELIQALLPYVESELTRGTPLKAIGRHLLGLFRGAPRARAWRRALSEAAPSSGPEAVLRALAELGEGVVDAPLTAPAPRAA